MPRPARLLILIAAALVVLAVPFALFGARLEGSLPAALEQIRRPEMMFAAVAATLAADIVLPVPSSMVSTLAGSELGTGLGALASWIGLSVGAVVGFALARRFGRPVAARLASPEDLAALDRIGDRQGTLLLVLLRALPLLAEASVLLLGTAG